MNIAVTIFLVIGAIFTFVGALGVLRMPDVFGRLQASTCIATLGTINIVIAGVLYAASSDMSAGVIVKLVLFGLLVILTNPVSNHALCKAAYHMGIRPEKGFEPDDYAADFGAADDAENEVKEEA